MRPYTRSEKMRILAGAITAVVMTSLIAVIALAFLIAPRR